MMQYIPIIGFVVMVIAGSGYWIEMYKGRARPNRVSVFLWGVQGTIAAAAAIADGVTWAVIPVVGSAVCPFIALTLSYIFKQASWKITKFDIVCACFSVLALVLWAVTGNPNIAICFAILADFAAGVPTIVKSWKHPETEAVIGYAPFIFGFASSFFALEAYTFAEIAFPAYGMLMCAFVSALIFVGHRRLKADADQPHRIKYKPLER